MLLCIYLIHIDTYITKKSILIEYVILNVYGYRILKYL